MNSIRVFSEDKIKIYFDWQSMRTICDLFVWNEMNSNLYYFKKENRCTVKDLKYNLIETFWSHRSLFYHCCYYYYYYHNYMTFLIEKVSKTVRHTSVLCGRPDRVVFAFGFVCVLFSLWNFYFSNNKKIILDKNLMMHSQIIRIWASWKSM